MLDLGDLLVSLAWVELAVCHRACQPTGSDCLCDLALENGDQGRSAPLTEGADRATNLWCFHGCTVLPSAASAAVTRLKSDRLTTHAKAIMGQNTEGSSRKRSTLTDKPLMLAKRPLLRTRADTCLRAPPATLTVIVFYTCGGLASAAGDQGRRRGYIWEPQEGISEALSSAVKVKMAPGISRSLLCLPSPQGVACGTAADR